MQITYLKILRILIFLMLIGPLSLVNAQFYEFGQSPSSLKWKKIEGPHFQVIYPEEIEQGANKVLLLLEKNYFINSNQLGKQPRKVPVVLHNHTVRSNGFVVWAPRRMEFFMYPDVNPISQDWYSHLSLHEFRHIVQLEKLNQGITKILTTVLGEQGIGPAIAMVPFWFLEGDAIYAETSLSESGRGRSPAFEMRLKAHILNDEKTWSYSKSYMGSYKHYVPDYYQYGYQMVTYGREIFGKDFWTGALDYTGRKFFLLNPFYFYMKKEAGISKKGFYDSTMNYLKSYWESKRKDRSPEKYPAFNTSGKNIYTSYTYPQIMEEGSVIAVKSGLDITDRFVKIDSTGNETTLFIPGYLHSGRISYSRNKILWDEYQPDVRWRNRSFSNLKEFNLETGKQKLLTVNSRYSSPSYSYSGDSIVAVETDLSNNFNLVFISASDGGLLNRIPSPENVQLLDPGWMDGSDKIIVTGLDAEGKKLLQYDPGENKWEVLLPSSAINISNPVSAGTMVIFNGSFDGVDNIYALDPVTKKLFRLTRSEFGAFHPDVSMERELLAFSSYTENGFDIVLKPLKEGMETFKPLNEISEQAFFKYGDSSGLQPAENSIDYTSQVTAKKYKPAFRLFNFHSWAPFYFDYNDPDIDHPSVSPGLTLLSQNLLSTAVTSLGYEYREKDHYFHTSFTYKGLLPVFDLSYRFGGLPLIVPYRDVSQPARVQTASNFSLYTYIPLSFYLGRWITGIQPSLRVSYQNDYFYYEESASYKRGISYTEPRLYLYTYQRSALRDYYPRFGMILDYSAIASPFEAEQRGSNEAFKSTVFLPGVIRGHGLRLKAEWQKQDPERFLFGNLVGFARGYVPLVALELNKYSADYHIPLMYPDLSIEGLFYLKRVRANFFGDYLYGKEMRIMTDEGVRVETGSYSSAGVEMNFDYHLFRLLFPVSSGLRSSYLYNTGEWNFEFLFNIYLDRF